MTPDNLERLRIIADGLGDLCHHVVFVGGSVAELYADDPAATEIRPTIDVDCIVEISSYGSFHNFEQLLRAHDFVNDIESGIICRWRYHGEIVDIMPTNHDILGFTNPWYHLGFCHKEPVILQNNTIIYLLPPLYYIATKIEAIKGRGGEDLRFSHDFEDLVYVLNNRSDIAKLFHTEKDHTLTSYLALWADEMLRRNNIREEIECMLPYGDIERVDIIMDILNQFAK